MNKIEHKKTQYTKSSLKKNFLYLIFTLLVFQNSIGQESIVIPDISIEIESDTFSFDKDAIPDFKIEPIKEEPIVVIEKVEKVIEEKEVVSPTIVEEIKEVQVVSENRNLGFFAGSNFCYSLNEFFVSPLFGLDFQGDGFSLLGKIEVVMGGVNKLYAGIPSENADFTNSSEKKRAFFALEKLDFQGNFELPFDLSLQTKVALNFYQRKDVGFDFFVPFGINLGYKGFLPWVVYVELGQKTLPPFENSFYGIVGGAFEADFVKDELEIILSKKIGVKNTFSFSSNWEKYEVLFTVNYFIKETPCFILGGIYKF